MSRRSCFSNKSALVNYLAFCSRCLRSRKLHQTNESAKSFNTKRTTGTKTTPCVTLPLDGGPKLTSRDSAKIGTHACSAKSSQTIVGSSSSVGSKIGTDIFSTWHWRRGLDSTRDHPGHLNQLIQSSRIKFGWRVDELSRKFNTFLLDLISFPETSDRIKPTLWQQRR